MDVNGRLPRSRLAPVAGGWLRRDAAAAFNAMNVESQRRFGVTLKPGGPISSYRTFAQQVEMRRFWCARGRCANAAIPGRSNHGWGIAVDIPNTQMQSIIRQIGAKYGWSKKWSDAPWEFWHVKYQTGIWNGSDPGVDDRWPVLKYGSRGPGVVRLKRKLNHLLNHPYELDDSPALGKRAVRAIRDFQRRQRLKVDGVVGPLTWKRLEAAQRHEPAPPHPSRDGMLRIGSRGNRVRRVQALLSRAGYPIGHDGVFGPQTRGAVMAFQTTHRLASDGVVGPRTFKALRYAAAHSHHGDGGGGGGGGGGRPHALSDRGANFIAGFEGFRSLLYNDPASGRNCTIGFGHLVHLGPCNGREPAAFRRGLSRGQAVALLRRDAGTAAAAVSKLINVPLNQQQFDALTSFTFNVGAGNLASSTLRRKLNAGDYGAVPGELMRWTKDGSGHSLGGLVTRRRAEGVLFTHGRY